METQQCTVYGYLYGAICDDLKVWDSIGGAQIVAVPSDQNRPTVDGLARPGRGATKLVVSDIDEGRFKQGAANAVMRSATDANGAFCFNDPDYQGGLLDLYVCIDRVPAPTLEEGYFQLERPCYLYLGTYQPVRFGDAWYLIVVIPSVVWCRIRRKADLWVILGRVTPCEDTSIGLGALTVTAKDADITQHDVLGTAVTNAAGIFRIDYTGDKFRQGTWLDVELFGGPDVYFEIKDSDGVVRLDESPGDGRQPGRCDRGPCFCVHLCVEVPVPPPPVPGIWTGVGDTFTIPDNSSLNDFEPEGYGDLPSTPGTTERYGFTGIIRMTGSAPLTTGGGNPIEYRFLVSDVTTDNGVAAPPAAAFTRIVGVGVDQNLFPDTTPQTLQARRVGQMIRFSPFKIVNIYAERGDLDADGWLDVNTSITRTFLTHPTLTPADIPSFAWVDLDGLMPIDTRPLTTAPNVPDIGQAGVPVPAGNRIGIEKKAIRFEIREVVNKPANIFNTMPGSGTTLNSIIVNNNPAYMKVAMTEHLSGAPCDVISVPPHVAYTVHHPHLQSTSISVRSNDYPAAGSYNVSLNDGSIPVSSNHTLALNHVNNPSAAVPATDPGGDPLKQCTYIVTLAVRRRLHNGDDPVSVNVAQTSFYYDPTP